MNPKSKGNGNLGQGSPKDLAKAHGSKNGLRMPKKRKQAEDAQGKEVGRGCPKG